MTIQVTVCASTNLTPAVDTPLSPLGAEICRTAHRCKSRLESTYQIALCSLMQTSMRAPVHFLEQNQLL